MEALEDGVQKATVGVFVITGFDNGGDEDFGAVLAAFGVEKLFDFVGLDRSEAIPLLVAQRSQLDRVGQVTAELLCGILDGYAMHFVLLVEEVEGWQLLRRR